MARQLDYHTLRAIFTRFRAHEPEPKGELEHVNAYTLVVAVALSAQATDAGVNKATRALFKIADTPEKMLDLGEEGLIEHIKTIGLYRNKARNVIKMLKELEPSVYARFWREFGSAIKDGVATVERCRGGLLERLRFETSLGGGLASLREYVSRMPAEQHHILCAMDRTTASQHEVLYVDSSDWEMLRSLEFDGRTFAELQAGGGAVAPAVQHTAAPQGGGWSPRMRRILEAHIEAQRERMDPASYQALMDQMAAQAATPWSV